MSDPKDHEYVLQIIDPWIHKYLDQGFDALSPVEMVGIAVWLIEAEVDNGGFDQYYSNPSGELAMQTEKALREVGALSVAQVMAEANAQFPNGAPPEDRRSRQRMLEPIRQTSA